MRLSFAIICYLLLTLAEFSDPQNTRTDAELIFALQRAWLLPRDGSSNPAAEAKFSLNATIGDEGKTIRS
jgi:hypothetical protein